jgi:glycerophosphoryl diester phosphodiesterase
MPDAGRRTEPVEIVAHRGAPSLADGAPENTLAAFRRAAALSADAVELDVLFPLVLAS